MLIGHSLGSSDGIILAIDEPVADLLQRPRREIVGRSYLAITHRDDRGWNAKSIDTLRPGAGPILMRKRYIASDGSTVIVDVQTSRARQADGAVRLIGSFFTIGSPDPMPRPHRLWRKATELLELCIARQEEFGADMFLDHMWVILLQLYVAEAEGRLIDLAGIAASLPGSPGALARWIAVLAGRGYIEDNGAASPPQLTQRGLDTLERLLAPA